MTYEDGSTLPAAALLRFYPQAPPRDSKTYPPFGAAITNAEGEFASAISHGRNGLVGGKHKVTVTKPKGGPFPPDAVPREYGDLQTTPLMVDTSDPTTFQLKIRKPTTK